MSAIDAGIHRPGPAHDEPPYSAQCIACSQHWPCPGRMAEVTQPDTLNHNPLRMLDISEVTVGCYVSWRGAESVLVGEPRGGVVIDIDHVLDEATGEVVRIFSTAKVHGGRIRFDQLRESQVGAITLPNSVTVRGLWRTMAREISRCRSAPLTDERRMADLIPLLIRSVS